MKLYSLHMCTRTLFYTYPAVRFCPAGKIQSHTGHSGPHGPGHKPHSSDLQSTTVPRHNMTSKNRVAENVHRQNNKDLHLQRNSLNRKHRGRFISKMFATFNGILKMKRARMYILCMHQGCIYYVCMLNIGFQSTASMFIMMYS